MSVHPELSPQALLTTTRNVRRRLDCSRPVDPAVIRECIETAVQAPTGGNRQGWHFVVVTDAARRRELAELYRRGFEAYAASPTAAGKIFQGDAVRGPQQQRVMASMAHLVEHLHEVPVLVIPCIEGRVRADNSFRMASHWGSLLPAAWSFMLAARLRGLGTAWTTFHLQHEREAAAVLGIPYEQVTQGALIAVAHTSGGDFRPARRKPLDEVIHLDGW